MKKKYLLNNGSNSSNKIKNESEEFGVLPNYHSKDIHFLKNCLALKVNTHSCLNNLSERLPEFDHLKAQTLPNTTNFSKNSLSLLSLWQRKEKGKRRSFQREMAVGYFSIFNEEIGQTEKLEKKVQVYNQMFDKEVNMAFLQSEFHKFRAYEIDIFKQVILFSGFENRYIGI